VAESEPEGSRKEAGRRGERDGAKEAKGESGETALRGTLGKEKGRGNRFPS